ncbi:hypothetical protein QCA50_007798 [Cerrena zonata]|uniref:DUF6534 domain-containing protein n=1 Tax=Cerrena zonata TaxID=2478898 RepID=A0AAW0G9L6_9APHY
MVNFVDAPPSFDVASFMGAFVVALCIALILYGVTSTQAYIYMLNCQKDSVFLKSLVSVVWLLETIHTVFMLRQIYYLTIISFGDIPILTTVDWSIGNGIISLVQGFYVYRIWILSGRRIVPLIVLSILLLACIGFHTTAAIYTFLVSTWPEFSDSFGATLSVEVANALSAALDGAIAAIMILLLRKGMTGIKKTDGIIRWLMVYIVNTGLLTMIVSISIAIVYSRLPHSLLASGLTTISGKLYSNSFLGLLNARDMMRKRHNSGGVAVLDSRGLELSNYQVTSSHGGPLPQITFSPMTEYTTSDKPNLNISTVTFEESGAKLSESTPRVEIGTAV